MDRATNKFYFLEVNTRLQVEHPITEAITGLDLVRIQLLVAMGHSLKEMGLVKGNSVSVVPRGHAIEVRLCAEDVAIGFVPCTGTIATWRTLPVPGVRYDTGIEDGSTVSIYYDSLLAKVIAYAETRAEAIQKLEYALSNLLVLGITTNAQLLRTILRHPLFATGDINTHFIASHNDQITRVDDNIVKDTAIPIAAMLWGWSTRERKRTLWRHAPSGWRNNAQAYQTDVYTVGESHHALEYKVTGANGSQKVFDVKVNSQAHKVGLVAHVPHSSYDEIVVIIDELQRTYYVARDTTRNFTDEDEYHFPRELYIHVAEYGSVLVTKQPRFPVRDTSSSDSSDPRISTHQTHVEEDKEGVSVYRAAMPGKVVKVLVKTGDEVKPGDVLVVMEAMKMETNMNATSGGVVGKVYVKIDDVVNLKAKLVEVNNNNNNN